MSTDCNTFPDLPLFKIKQILTKLILDQKQPTASLRLSANETTSTIPTIFSNELLRQTISIAENRIDTHALNAENRRTRMFEPTDSSQSSQCDHQILTAITHRQETMFERAQYQLTQNLAFKFRQPFKIVNR